ncbi:hypothetical protein FZEAL_1963 [Fusarium zealandicum]|uniref:Uncharacterized protein n=1 Tax=Fusarium zealandicum TaxID=1053134 RepID=A0A8H4USH7_9HYPO|nr:hypothetical protein FZEAL_1963 [Fusarium zealandicum]
MGSSTSSNTKGVSVIDYALSQHCFHDHQDAPYRFQDQLRQLQRTARPVESDGLVHQNGLIVVSLPRPRINLDLLSDDETCSVPVDPSIPSSSVFSSLRQAKKLRLPSESLDLGYNLEQDLQQYLADIYNKQSCNIFGEWLPLSPVEIDKDESLIFPSSTSRWQQLALRELDQEFIASPGEVIKLLYYEDLNSSSKASVIREVFPLPKQPKRYPEPVSLPLSPASELDEPFLPNAKASFVDLTSEPSSPIDPAVEKLQQGLRDGCLDSEPAGSSMMPSSPPAIGSMFLGPATSRPSELRLDVPLMASSSPNGQGQTPFGEVFALEDMMMDNPIQSPLRPPRFFDEAMLAILEGCHDRADQILEEERFNPANSLLRLQVPAVDFCIPDPESKSHLSSAQDHFGWLQISLFSAFRLPPSSQPSRLGASLKWTPVPHGSGRIAVNEILEQPGSASKALLGLDSTHLCSRDYISKPLGLKILHMLEDEEIEDQASAIVSSPNPIAHETSKGVPVLGTPTVTSKLPSLEDLLKSSHLPGTQCPKRKAVDDPASLLLDSNNPSATSMLLSNFIELRNLKKPKTTGKSARPSVSTSLQSRPPAASVASHQAVPEREHHEIPEAPVPEFRVPEENCRYIVSMGLNRNILSNIEKAWPQVELVDRDFSQYNQVVWSPSSAQRNQVISPLSFEADISLCPSAGLIVTTMLKIRQKPLPGSTTLTPIRERVQNVSGKYESLYILVSEVNPKGEFVGALNTSELTAYADFVRFTTSLQADITTYLIPGAEQTLSSWVLSLMCRYAPQAARFGQYLDYRDSTWELFLRRAGLNISAAQVLSGALLSEYRNLGLAHFLAMATEDRLSRYGQALGGERVLRNASMVLEQEWL